MKAIILFALLIITNVASTQNQLPVKGEFDAGKAEREVRQLIGELDAAHLSGDAAVVDRILADDFETISFSGGVKGRSQAVTEWKAGKNRYESYNNDDVKIRLYGDTAVVTALNTRKSSHDLSNVGRFRTTRVFIRRLGRWQMVASQATRLAS